MGLTPISSRLFRHVVTRCDSAYDFTHSWAYILQATRGHVRGLVSTTSLAVITSRRDSFVVPFFETQDLATLCHQLSLLGKPVIFKNVASQQKAELIALGARTYDSGEGWSPSCRFDDQTFPQRVYQLSEMIALRGRRYSRVREELNQFSRVASSSLEFSRYDPQHHKDYLIELLTLQDSRNPGTFESHEMYLSLEGDEFLVPTVFFLGDSLVGYSLIDGISDTCAAYNALIYSSEVPNLSTAITLETARIAKQQGYTHFNFQGSETASLDRWKRKFNPCISIEKTHLVLPPQDI